MIMMMMMMMMKNDDAHIDSLNTPRSSAYPTITNHPPPSFPMDRAGRGAPHLGQCQPGLQQLGDGRGSRARGAEDRTGGEVENSSLSYPIYQRVYRWGMMGDFCMLRTLH